VFCVMFGSSLSQWIIRFCVLFESSHSQVNITLFCVLFESSYSQWIIVFCVLFESSLSLWITLAYRIQNTNISSDVNLITFH